MSGKAFLGIFSVFLSVAAFAGQPQLRTLHVAIDPYTVPIGGSNAVIVVYKSTSLGTVFTPFKPTSYFPASRTNQAIQVVSGQLYHFYCTAIVQPFSESAPSNVVTNQVQ